MPDLMDSSIGFPGRSISAFENAGVLTASSDGTSITSGGSGNTKGAWTQLIASTSKACVGFIVEHGNGSQGLLDIGTGAAASETVLVGDLGVGTLYGAATPRSGRFLVFAYIPAGTRIAARWQQTGVSQTMRVAVLLLEEGDRPTTFPHPRVFPVIGSLANETAGADETTSKGTVVTGGAGNTKGSWVQLIASTARRTFWLVMFVMYPSQNNYPDLIDIGTGGAGSEVVLIPNILVNLPAQTDCYAIGIPVSIPAGTRIAARLQNGTSSKSDAIHLVLCEEE